MRSRLLRCAAIAGVVMLAGACAPQHAVRYSDLFASGGYDGITDPREATEEVCDGIDGCVEGWVADEGRFLRFEAISRADAYAATLGDDGFQSNFLIIAFNDDVDQQTREWAADIVRGAHQDIEE